jgi:tetratricopeptide (TPR) repeat protein
MTSLERVQRQQRLRHAEGYLELGMPGHALQALADFTDPDATPHMAFYLRGEAYRELKQFGDAIASLRKASDEMPGNLHVWLAMGWCYKRIQRIDLAIEALEEALEAAPDEAIVHYNLACYWSLAGNKRQSILFLSRAFEIDGAFRDKVAEESDFDPIREDPNFQRLTSLIA